MPSTTTAAQQTLKLLLGKSPSIPAVASLKICLSKSLISQNGTGRTEPIGGGYARLSMDTNTFGTPENSKISNASLLTFPVATSGWGEIKEIFISDGTTIYFHEPVVPPILVNAGTTVVIQPGALAIDRKIIHYETE